MNTYDGTLYVAMILLFKKKKNFQEYLEDTNILLIKWGLEPWTKEKESIRLKKWCYTNKKKVVKVSVQPL